MRTKPTVSTVTVAPTDTGTSISVREAAVLLGHDRIYIYNLLWSGKLTGTQESGIWTVDAESVRARLAKRAARHKAKLALRPEIVRSSALNEIVEK